VRDILTNVSGFIWHSSQFVQTDASMVSLIRSRRVSQTLLRENPLLKSYNFTHFLISSLLILSNIQCPIFNLHLSIQSPVWPLPLQYSSCVITEFNGANGRRVCTFQVPHMCLIFSKTSPYISMYTMLLWGIWNNLYFRGLLFGTTPNIQQSSRIGYLLLPPVCQRLTGAERLVITHSNVRVACWIMTHARSAAKTRRSMLQYTESVYNYSDTEYDSY